ncbi:hypothetical protein Poli38472_010310 [Pythium oligandrum]|uniref:Uncharacterized protein n=1 Tax=Pythium oligandrum TaxID=41045 RepID=A0A8K1C2U5_PYTOL|nr:hypothetical protein Poli38472_010310 [Pythium oligandrum]|eukprot:TMW55428.1 hypothetical protein Poli38472_010310 [Pythium oligandrum]
MRAIKSYKYVTLDATGTLMRPREPIGRIYLVYWQRLTGQKLATNSKNAMEEEISTRFLVAFHRRSLARPNFGRAEAPNLDHTAYTWWRELILDSLPSELVAPLDSDAKDTFTKELYAHYATGEAWHVFDDVRPTLNILRDKRVPMAVVSNFDERLPQILQDLELSSYFETITTSWDEGVMKPDAVIFDRTFRRLGIENDVLFTEVLHVGDHAKRDYRGALAIGAQARVIHRGSTPPPDGIPHEHVLSSLAEMC